MLVRQCQVARHDLAGSLVALRLQGRVIRLSLSLPVGFGGPALERPERPLFRCQLVPFGATFLGPILIVTILDARRELAQGLPGPHTQVGVAGSDLPMAFAVLPFVCEERNSLYDPKLKQRVRGLMSF